MKGFFFLVLCREHKSGARKGTMNLFRSSSGGGSLEERRRRLLAKEQKLTSFLGLIALAEQMDQYCDAENIETDEKCKRLVWAQALCLGFVTDFSFTQTQLRLCIFRQKFENE